MLLAESYQKKVSSLEPSDPRYAVDLIELLMAEARNGEASDIHLLPTADGLETWWRIDGVLQLAGTIPREVAPNVISRLKILAELMTYRTDIPQEGRIQGGSGGIEMRVSTFPTVYGEKAVVRIFAGVRNLVKLDELGLPEEVRDKLRLLLSETSGAILLAGPAGSGKSTTIYACLRELISSSRGGRSLVTLEDPVEVIVPGAAQSQVNLAAGFTLAAGLRSLMRQDPEVIGVGEIRDHETAEIAFQASLTGHLVLSTFHAGSAAGVVSRLSEMGIEPYVLRSGLRAIICQRLVRRLCSECSVETTDPGKLLGLPVAKARIAVGCPACRGTGYHGRLLLAELLLPDDFEVSWAILSRTDLEQLETSAIKAGMVSRWERARHAVEAGLTDPSEVRRVLGFGDRWERAQV